MEQNLSPQEVKKNASLQYMRSAALALSEMLERTVSEVRRLQKQEEVALGHRFETRAELQGSYDTKSMKELTAILKDVAAVEKALNESNAEQEAALLTGVVVLPPILQESEHETN